MNYVVQGKSLLVVVFLKDLLHLEQKLSCLIAGGVSPDKLSGKPKERS